MSENKNVKKKAVEAKVLEPKVEEPKNFTVTVTDNDGKKFFFSGPIESTASSRESIIHALFSNYAHDRIHLAKIETAKAAEEAKAKVSEVKETQKKETEVV